MKKILLLAVIALMMTTAFGTVNLTFWHSMADYQRPVLDTLVSEFNSSHPGIHVTAIYQGTYDQMVTKLKTSLLSNRGPDIAQINIENLPVFVDNNQLLDLSALISPNDPSLPSKFIDSFWKTVVFNGKAYALPFNISVLMLFYNKDLFSRAGLNPNDPPKTWEQMVEMAKKLTVRSSPKARPSQYGLFWGVQGDSSAFYQFEPLIWENGGRVFNSDMTKSLVDQPAAIDALKAWKNWFDMGISPANMTEDEGVQAFMMGKIAMGPMTSGGIRYAMDNLPWNLGVAMLPANKDNVTTLGGASLAIMKTIPKSKEKAAWEFIKWMTDEKNTLYWYENTGYLPVLKSALNSLQIQLIWKKYPQLKAAVDAIPYARPRPINVDIIEIRHILFNAIEEVRLGKTTPELAFSNAAGRIDVILNKLNSKN